MNLSFATKFPARKKAIAGKPTNFVEKIWTGFPIAEEKWDKDYSKEYFERFGNPHAPHGICPKPKIHTIRRDEKLRWHKGNYIHFNIKQSPSIDFNFAPVIQCTGKERIKIVWWKSSPNPIVVIGDTVLNLKAIEQLAFNDGFDSVDDFFSWFDKDFEGWIIHWTPYRYEVNQIEVDYLICEVDGKEVNVKVDAKIDCVDALAYAIKSKHKEIMDPQCEKHISGGIDNAIERFGALREGLSENDKVSLLGNDIESEEVKNWCNDCQKPIRMRNNTLQPLCECGMCDNY